LNLCTTSGIEPSIVPNNTDISITQIIQIHFRYISTSGFSKSMQIPHLHILLLCYTVIDRYWPTTCRNTHFSQRNLISRLYALRSLLNLHHWKDLFLATQFEYKLDIFWIRGFEVIGCQSPKILTPDLVEPRDHNITLDITRAPYPPDMS